MHLRESRLALFFVKFNNLYFRYKIILKLALHGNLGDSNGI